MHASASIPWLSFIRKSSKTTSGLKLFGQSNCLREITSLADYGNFGLTLETAT